MQLRFVLAMLPALAVALPGGFQEGPAIRPLGRLGPQSRVTRSVDPCEGRIRIDAANTPGDADSVFRITAPGSYWLDGDVVGEAGKHGIEVATAGSVTVDLNGFSLVGVPGSLDGLVSTASTVVTNGSAREWGGRGIAIGQGRLEGIHATFNGGDGLRALWGSLVTGCTAEGNGGDGISVSDVSRIDGCVSKGNQGHGIRLDGACIVSDCVIYNNDGGGILGGLSTIRDNELFSNQGHSIELTGFAVVTGNDVTAGVTGIFTSGTRSRIDGNTIGGCLVAIDVDGTENLVARNALHGNTSGIEAVTGNALGPIVDVGGVGDVGAVADADHPLANLEY